MTDPISIQVPNITKKAFQSHPATATTDTAKSLSEVHKEFDQTRTVPAHFHNNVDSDRIDYNSLFNKPRGRFYLSATWKNTEPQTANNFLGARFIAPIACKVISVRETHQQGGTSPTLMMQKNGPGGTDILASSLDLSGGGGTVQVATLHATLANRNLAVNDFITFAISGTLTSLQGLCVTVELEPI